MRQAITSLRASAAAFRLRACGAFLAISATYGADFSPRRHSQREIVRKLALISRDRDGTMESPSFDSNRHQERFCRFRFTVLPTSACSGEHMSPATFSTPSG